MKSRPHPPTLASHVLRVYALGEKGSQIKVPLSRATVYPHLDFVESQCRGTSPRAPAFWGTHSPKPPALECWGFAPRFSATALCSIGRIPVWREFEGNNCPSIGVWGHPPMPLKQGF